MGFNAKLFEVIIYPDSYDIGTLDDTLTNGAIKNYAFILHDKDENRKDHYHIFIRTIDTRNSEYVAKWFNVKENQIEKVKGRFTDALRYLTHANAPTKFQYSPDLVKSNYDWQTEAEKKTRSESEKEIYKKKQYFPAILIVLAISAIGTYFFDKQLSLTLTFIFLTTFVWNRA